MGWSLLGACVEPTQEPGNATLFWSLHGCGRNLLFMGRSLQGACVEPVQQPGNSTLLWVLLRNTLYLKKLAIVEPVRDRTPPPSKWGGKFCPSQAPSKYLYLKVGCLGTTPGCLADLQGSLPYQDPAFFRRA